MANDPFMSNKEKQMRYAVPALGMIIFLVASEVQSQDKPDADKAKLQGTWIVELMESGPIKTKPKKKTSYVFSGTDLTIKEEGMKDDKRTCKLDASKKPKEIDFIDANKNTMKAAYELDGDTLKIAYPPMADTRPKAVDPKDSTVYHLKKEKK